jgi:hypothetical protein
MSTTSTTDTTNPKTLEMVREVSKAFANGPAKVEVQRFAKFLNAVLDNPDEVPPVEAFLEYFQPDPAKGREIIEKLGVNATLADLKAALADGTVTQ